MIFLVKPSCDIIYQSSIYCMHKQYYLSRI
ncbi:hypothetical protein CPT_Mana_050 [Burkholderia phage Mana]|uniref:Uncharacterized protein n=1 Tax=Burkholderia phage Mana TaxID=2767578 RepID=A0A873WN01_9CAUD|nr:hypothetical protein KNV21_gp50 [Burkholderia phage Mana]QPB09445.1 hypothetical protein CPT_Mana_050 [Burkholderia phage Mana]